MEVKCEDGCMFIVPEDAQDKAYLESLLDNDRVVLVRQIKPRGFVDGPDFVLATEETE